MPDKTHAEIEAEIFDLMAEAQTRSNAAKRQQQAVDDAVAAQKRAAEDMADRAKALHNARSGLEKAAHQAIAQEAAKMRRSALMADWAAILSAAMLGVLIGGGFVYAWATGLI